MKKDQEQSPELYTRRLAVHASDVDAFRHLRMSRLSGILQELSIAHTERLGFTRRLTLDKGLLWILTRLRISVMRPILYDEELEFCTWPRPALHMLYPREYRIFESSGAQIGEAAALWAIIDASTRRIALPSETGISIPGTVHTGQLPLPQGLSPAFCQNAAQHTVTYSEIDLNGHVNNTRYLDWIDDLQSEEWHRAGFSGELQINYMHEILPGSVVSVHVLSEEAPTSGSLCQSRTKVTGCLPGDVPAFVAMISRGH